jgi:hypothetical protein
LVDTRDILSSRLSGEESSGSHGLDDIPPLRLLPCSEFGGTFNLLVRFAVRS